MDIENSALTYRAIIYHPKQDEKHIKKLIDKGAQVFDQLNEQLVELIKIKHPNEPFDLIKANKRIRLRPQISNIKWDKDKREQC